MLHLLLELRITKEHLFIVDDSQYVIQKYNLREGNYISSLDYGQFLKQKPPFRLPYQDVNNIPFVTLNETILLPSHTGGKFLYQAINWQGDKLAGIGEMPEGYTAREDNDEIRTALKNQNVPARDSSLAFPVSDRSNPDEIFLVYSAIPRIAKYRLSGQKIWERNIPRTPEVDSLMIDLRNFVEDNPNRTNALLPVRKYVSGRSSPDGDLYLSTYTNLQAPIVYRPIWIHRFDAEGKLVARYKIEADKVLMYFPGIDFKGRRIFVPLFKDTGIRIYHF